MSKYALLRYPALLRYTEFLKLHKEILPHISCEKKQTSLVQSEILSEGINAECLIYVCSLRAEHFSVHVTWAMTM